MNPYDKLKSLTEAEKYLKKGNSFKIMDKIAYAMTDNQSPQRLQKALMSLFQSIDERELKIS